MLDNIIENLELIEPHKAFFILKNCLSIPKLIYLLRSAPCFKCKEEPEVFDTAIKTNMEKICNVSFGDENLSQASLPIRHTGLGLLFAADLSLPWFLSSSHACKGLVKPFTSLSQPGNPLWVCKRCNWRLVRTPSFITTRKGIQAAWDDLACRDTLNSLLNTNIPLEPLSVTCCTRESHYCLVRSVPNCQCWKLAQSWWAPYCNRPPNWCQNLWKHKTPLRQNCWWAGVPWLLLY